MTSNAPHPQPFRADEHGSALATRSATFATRRAVLTMDSDIPASLLKEHPELVAVGQALDQRRHGEPIIARCVKCGLLLEIEEVAATGVVIVRCATGDTVFRIRHAKGISTKAEATQ
jgi:hypothetical protein